jgi:hypothetical protein
MARLVASVYCAQPHSDAHNRSTASIMLMPHANVQAEWSRAAAWRFDSYMLMRQVEHLMRRMQGCAWAHRRRVRTTLGCWSDVAILASVSWALACPLGAVSSTSLMATVMP